MPNDLHNTDRMTLSELTTKTQVYNIKGGLRIYVFESYETGCFSRTRNGHFIQDNYAYPVWFAKQTRAHRVAAA